MDTNIREAKLKELEDDINKQKEYHIKLSAEIEKVSSNIKTLDGAIQGFKLAMQMEQDEIKSSDAHNTGTVTDIVENK
jgi:septal ring factor EnvC (AmiA/AmiB activator)